MDAPFQSDDQTARLITLDWGTSTVRAYLLNGTGAVLESRAEPWGIMHVPRGDFRDAFQRLVGEWLIGQAGLQAVASGMIGSAQGWVEAPYCSTPAGVDELSRAIVRVPDVPLFIVPGIAEFAGRPDVMRGEETQIVGALAMRPDLAAHSMVVLPGSHSKWVRIRDGRVHGFATFVTGELFAVLRTHSILGRLAPDAAHLPRADRAADAFARGALTARSTPGGIAPLLFSARAEVLAGRLAADQSMEYLSGLLIGDEVRCGLADGEQPEALIGDRALCARYNTVLELFGAAAAPVIEVAAPAGLWSIAQRASLAGPTRPRAVA